MTGGPFDNQETRGGSDLLVVTGIASIVPILWQIYLWICLVLGWRQQFASGGRYCKKFANFLKIYLPVSLLWGRQRFPSGGRYCKICAHFVTNLFAKMFVMWQSHSICEYYYSKRGGLRNAQKIKAHFSLQFIFANIFFCIFIFATVDNFNALLSKPFYVIAMERFI